MTPQPADNVFPGQIDFTNSRSSSSSSSVSNEISHPNNDEDNTSFYIGLGLALGSTLFIGASYIVKKIALQRLASHGIRSSDGGYGYLLDWVWWCGMLSMIVGEVCNFMAYAFAPATIVTPLGALSIIVSSILGHIVLKERLNLHGKLGAILTILGSTVMVISAPKEPEIENLYDLEAQVLNPLFLLYATVAIGLALYLIIVVEPIHGRTNIFIYILICSIIGGFTVACVKGAGIGIKQFLSSDPEFHINIFKEPFAYVLGLALFVTLTTQINYLNRSLDIFDASLVSPIYYVIFTTCVLLMTAILFEEWDAVERGSDVVSIMAGFGTIIVGTFLLHSFKSFDVTLADLKEQMRLDARRRRDREQGEQRDGTLPGEIKDGV